MVSLSLSTPPAGLAHCWPRRKLLVCLIKAMGAGAAVQPLLSRSPKTATRHRLTITGTNMMEVCLCHPALRSATCPHAPCSACAATLCRACILSGSAWTLNA
jgi:hypothetical protein